MNELHISEAGVNFIKQWESLSLKKYNLFGIDHIGYGHVIRNKMYYHNHGIISVYYSIQKGIITEEQAELLLAANLSDFECVLSSIACFYGISQCQFDSLMSFVYNLGPELTRLDFVLKKSLSCLKTAISVNSFGGTSHQFMSPSVTTIHYVLYIFRCYIHNSKGIALHNLFNRRSAECRLFLWNKYDILDNYSTYTGLSNV